MSNYIPDYRKKKETLAHREWKLLCALDHGDPEKRIMAAAEQVRQARLRAIRSERAQLPVHDGLEAEGAAKLDAEVDRWSAMTVGEIIARYRHLSSQQRARIYQAHSGKLQS